MDESQQLRTKLHDDIDDVGFQIRDLRENIKEWEKHDETFLGLWTH